MAWVYLLIAGCFEVSFTSMLKLSDNFTRLWPSLLFLIFSIASFGFLNLAVRTIPIGTAYAVWTGIGAFGTATMGIVYFKEPATPGRLAFLAILVAAIIGLKLVSPEHEEAPTTQAAPTSAGEAG
ncbi:MAG: multidrug efflux SMR transporter [Gemmataceae bacterium]